MPGRERSPRETRNWRRQILGASLVALAGVALLSTRLGLGLDHFSYDALFLFSSSPVPTNVVLVKMDEQAQRDLLQPRGAWDRGLHAELLGRLRRGGAAAVVFDVFFTEPGNETTNALLAAAMAAHGRVVLCGELSKITDPGFSGWQPVPPKEPFHHSAAVWGLGNIDPEPGDHVVRRLFPGTDLDPSLAWAAATVLKAPVTTGERTKFFSQPRWLRYYGESGALQDLNYYAALKRPPEFFRDKIVFVGWKPRVLFGGEEAEEFSGPATRWRGPNLSGMDIHATALLNLLRGEWLVRLPWLAEVLLLCAASTLFVFGLNRVPTRWIAPVALATLLVLTIVTMLVHFTLGVWFGWATVAGVQLPLACIWTLRERRRFGSVLDTTVKISGHTLLRSIGRGAYGEVWLARDMTGRLHAVKVIHRNKFPSEVPFEREFRGIQKFTPISRSHPGFVHILHVDRDDVAGYFYYVMEVGDDERYGQRFDPGTYVARTLANELNRRGRLSIAECLDLSVALASALEHLHEQQLIHRDIKPSNIIFVNNVPKLADIGLVTDIEQEGRRVTYIGTEGYMPPEGPGTPAGDVYSLGKVIYEAAMGKPHDQFPELPSTLLDSPESMKPLFELNEIIIRACAPDLLERYRTAAELRADLLAFRERLTATRC